MTYEECPKTAFEFLQKFSRLIYVLLSAPFILTNLVRWRRKIFEILKFNYLDFPDILKEND